MSPNAYRKMIDKVCVSDEKRQETAELLKQQENGTLFLPDANRKSKWFSPSHFRRYLSAAACAVLILTGLLGIPESRVPIADGSNGDAGAPSEDAPTENAAESALPPTVSLAQYHLSMEPAFPQAFSFGDTAAKANLLANNPLDSSFISAVQQFSWRSASKLMAGQSGNITYSPTSVYLSLAMAGTGAGGRTKQEFLSLLGVNDIDFLSKQCGNLFRRSYISNEIGTIKMANSLWLSQYEEFQSSYVQNTLKNFYASIYNVDFADGNAGEKINHWISANTDGTLSPQIKTDPSEVLSIVNTLYFKDQWVHQFDVRGTCPGTFTMVDGRQKIWEFMNGTFETKYLEGNGFISASLEMRNVGRMLFVLPDQGVGVDDLLSSPEKIASLFDMTNSSKGKVAFSIPKFSMGSGDMDLKNMLTAMGLGSAFGNSADFSGISKNLSCLSRVEHEAHVQIDENGAASTSDTGSHIYTSPKPTLLTLDRPFLYAVVSNDGLPLFMGVCEEPVNN